MMEAAACTRHGQAEAAGRTSDGWKKFLRNHPNVLFLFIIAAVAACAGAVMVLLWFVGHAQSTGMVPATLGLWTAGNLVTFFLYLIFWELLLVGMPAAVAGTAGWRWWKRLPGQEREEYHFSRKRSRKMGESSGISLLFYIAFFVKVYLDGNWNVAIASWGLDYVVYSIVWILASGLIIIGIPGAIGAVWWLRREMEKTP